MTQHKRIYVPAHPDADELSFQTAERHYCSCGVVWPCPKAPQLGPGALVEITMSGTVAEDGWLRINYIDGKMDDRMVRIPPDHLAYMLDVRSLRVLRGASSE